MSVALMPHQVMGIICVCVYVCVYVSLFETRSWCVCVYVSQTEYGVASISRLLKIIGLFCKRAL